MPLAQYVGQKIIHTISNRALGTMDAYPGVIFDMVPGENPRNGQPSPIATIIVERKNLAGETYLAVEEVPARFLLLRYTPVEAIDGTPDKPKSLEALGQEVSEKRLAFIQSNIASQGAAALAAELETELGLAAPAVD